MMRREIHPDFHQESKVFCNGEEVLTTSGTKPEYKVDIWSGNHPFYQGMRSQIIMDEGQVSKFMKRFGAGSDSRFSAVTVMKGGKIVEAEKKDLEGMEGGEEGEGQEAEERADVEAWKREVQAKKDKKWAKKNQGKKKR